MYLVVVTKDVASTKYVPIKKATVTINTVALTFAVPTTIPIQ